MTPKIKHKLEQERLQQEQPALRPQSEEKSSFSLTGIIGSVFKGNDAAKKVATPTDLVQLPPSVHSSAAAQNESSVSSLGPVVAGLTLQGAGASPSHPAMAKAADGGFFSSSVRQPTLEGSPDRHSSSDELSQSHRTKIQESSPSGGEEASRSISPVPIPMLMSQAIRSGTTGGDRQGEEEDVVIMEGKSSRSKKSKGRKKKKKKKPSPSTSTVSTPPSANATEDDTAAAPAMAASVKEEEGVAATERDEEPSVSLDDFVDTFGKGGVEAGQLMPSLPPQAAEPSNKTSQPASIPEGNGTTGGVIEKSIYYDYEPSELLPPRDEHEVGSKKKSDDSSRVNNKPLSLELEEAEQEKRLEGRGDLTTKENDGDEDFHLSPDFVKTDLLSEALDELNREKQGGDPAEDILQRERASPSKDVVNSSPVDEGGFNRTSPPKTRNNLAQQTSMEWPPLQNQHEQTTSEERTPSENQLQEGDTSPETEDSAAQRTGDGSNQAKNPLHSSSDSALQGHKGFPGGLTASWSTGQYKPKAPKKGGFRRPRLNHWRKGREKSPRNMDAIMDEFDIIELPNPHPPPEPPPSAGDLVCPQDSNFIY